MHMHPLLKRSFVHESIDISYSSLQLDALSDQAFVNYFAGEFFKVGLLMQTNFFENQASVDYINLL